MYVSVEGLALVRKKEVLDMDIISLKKQIIDLIEMEARGGSMEPALMTPEYISRMLGPVATVEEIEAALKEIQRTVAGE